MDTWNSARNLGDVYIGFVEFRISHILYIVNCCLCIYMVRPYRPTKVCIYIYIYTCACLYTYMYMVPCVCVLCFRLLYIIHVSTMQENRKTNYIQKITRELLGWTASTQEASGAWNKAALTTSLCQYVEHFCRVRQLQHSCDERERLVVPRHFFFTAFSCL